MDQEKAARLAIEARVAQMAEDATGLREWAVMQVCVVFGWVGGWEGGGGWSCFAPCPCTAAQAVLLLRRCNSACQPVRIGPDHTHLLQTNHHPTARWKASGQSWAQRFRRCLMLWPGAALSWRTARRG